MSELESSDSYLGYGLADAQWLCMVTLFIASLITLLLYFVQYFTLGTTRGKSTASKDNVNTRAEAEALLGWALSLKSWKDVWRAAWCRALNGESRKCRSLVVFTFEEDGLEASELHISQVTNFQKSPTHKAACCRMVAEKLHFSLSVSSTNSPAALPCKYKACIEPLEMQLDLLMKEAEGEVQVTWGISQLDSSELQLTLEPSQVSPCSQSMVKEQLYQLLCRTHPSVSLSYRSSEDLQNNVASPPKPPRAHEWKLLVKNIHITYSEEGNAAGSINPQCTLQLDDPPQKFCTSVVRNVTNATWEQPFIFELNGRSKELKIQVVNDGQLEASSLLGQVSVPFDLVKKHPKGRQTYALMTKYVVTGSLTTEFTYLEPSEVRSWQSPTPVSTKKIEMDRTVMPCGTVVTTITAVKSKPGRPLPVGLSIDSSQKVVANKPKLSERRVSEQSSLMRNAVNKALSSSDTELLMLNGTDPVAEAAIRQLHHSAKQKLKSPVKKSTIIISGITKTPLSQDDELTLMAGYAAAMDASMSESSSSQDVTTAKASGSLSPPDETNAQEGPSGMGRPPEDWESNAGDELDNSSLSMCVSEANCKKSRGSFLQKGARLFFRRRHQRKEPGMSQSHNDLVYLDSPTSVERASRTATLSRMLSRKSKPKCKANGSTSTGDTGEPHA
ncbi:unnamed protein product [Knipowitschia caucasica]|uniref:C2 domain-containing protein n=1 Tax=Knipowitschia caucasica TaxID=637954 RepID=A0AAV2JBS1_KNICA